MAQSEKGDHASEQAQAQYESIVEMVERLRKGDDEVMDEIYEDPLSVQVRSGWERCAEKFEASEYEIFLCTGGPAVHIIGDLDTGQPVSAKLHPAPGRFTSWQTWYEADAVGDEDADRLIRNLGLEEPREL